MVDLAESSRPVDMITLIEELDRHKELQPVGDVGYVSGLLDGVPDRPSIAHYISIVREKALLRGLIHTATSAIARAAEQSEPAEMILDEAESAIFQLSEQRIGRGFFRAEGNRQFFVWVRGCSSATRPANQRIGHALRSLG
jgi:replicative DNA helicase